MSSRGRARLVNRVALGAAVAAALGGGVAALAAGVAAHELVSRHEEAALRAAAHEMADELHEALADDQAEDEGDGTQTRAPSMDQRLLHELDDLKLRGARAVLRAGPRTLAGDASLPELAPDTCRAQPAERPGSRAGHTLRVCAVPFDAATLILAVPGDAERARGALITHALWIGLLSGALLGGLFSWFVARWALAPLTALRDRVRAVKSDEPEVAVLAPPAAHVEVEELRSAIANLVERLGSALNHAQAFAGEAAHELRTPLTTIAGELELLSEESCLDVGAIARVRGQVAALIALVQRLLILAQPAAPAQRGAEAVDLGDVASAVFDALAKAAQARVRMMVADDVLVRGEPTLLRAMLSNAVENALKFSSGPVEVAISKDGEQACIDVQDRGPGVAEAERAHVFTPFYRAPEVRARGAEGHGLGLPLIAKVALLHGGSAAFLPSTEGAHLGIRIPAFSASRISTPT